MLEGRRAKLKPNFATEYLSPPQLAGTLAHPQWLGERWAGEYGFATAARICAYDQQPPPTTVRLRASSPGDSKEVEKVLEQEGVKLAPGALLHLARRVIAGDLTKTKAFARKRVYI